MADTKYIDLDSALARLGGNQGLYEKLLAKFESNIDMDSLDKAIAAGDYKAAGDIVHTAKGVAGNLSLMAFFDQSVLVMGQLREGEYNEADVAKYKQLFVETVAAVNEMIGK